MYKRQEEIAGTANAETRIEVLDRLGPLWRYALFPVTGKKHQLRVHLCALGAPIVDDEWYPRPDTRSPDDFTRPLKLLAQGLQFVDPLNQEVREFTSRFTL